MNRRVRWATGNKVRVVDRTSPYFSKIGVLTEPKKVRVYGKLQYHWFVKFDDTFELFAPEQLEKIE